MIKKPKVLWLLTHRIQYFTNLLNRLHEREKVEPVVIYAHESDKLADKDFGLTVDWSGGTSVSCREYVLKDSAKRSNEGFWSSYSRELLPLIKQLQPDVIHLNGWRNAMSIQAWWWARQRGIPYFVRGDGDMLGNKPRWKTRIRESLYTPFLSNAHTVMIQGRSNADYMLAGGAKKDRLEWIPCVSNTELFGPRVFPIDSDRNEFRVQHGASEDEIVFVVSGKLIARKRPQDVIDAMALLKDSPYKIWFLGSGELEAELKERAATALIDEKIVWLGFQEQKYLPKFMQAADCFIHPSEMDPWPYAIVDAAMSGLPLILSSRVGSSPDWSVEPAAALVYECGCANSLSECMDKLGKNPDLYKFHSENARKQVERHTEDVYCDIFEKCVKKALP